METDEFASYDWIKDPGSPKELALDSGSQVAVIGSGPAGSFFSYFLLEMAERMGLDIQVDLYEVRDFSRTAPQGCNMCGGIVSETLVQNLAADGINLPSTVIQRAIDSYVLHMDVGKVRIDTPMLEKRIGAVIRGSGPRGAQENKWQSFDGHLQALAVKKGANLIGERVAAVKVENGLPVLKTRQGSSKSYDLVAVAVGVNSPTLRMFEGLLPEYHSPGTTKTFICEYYLGDEKIKEVLGNSMHVFLLNIPRLKFAAVIPKGDYATVCMLGEDIDDDLINTFLNSTEVKETMPPGWQVMQHSCSCMPRMNIKGATQPFGDRIIFIGDCGVTRLYKDGIGAAYRTSKAAATTVIFQGVSAQDFKKYYLPVCNSITIDNAIGRLSFKLTGMIQNFRFARRALLNMTMDEQKKNSRERRMSTVMWDMFTGSASYGVIFLRTLHPVFLSRFMWNTLKSLLYR